MVAPQALEREGIHAETLRHARAELALAEAEARAATGKCP